MNCQSNLSHRRPVWPTGHAVHVAWPSVARKHVGLNLDTATDIRAKSTSLTHTRRKRRRKMKEDEQIQRKKKQEKRRNESVKKKGRNKGTNVNSISAIHSVHLAETIN